MREKREPLSAKHVHISVESESKKRIFKFTVLRYYKYLASDENKSNFTKKFFPEFVFLFFK